MERIEKLQSDHGTVTGVPTGFEDLDRLPARQPPSLANPTPQEIAAAQARGRIRDRERPTADLSEQDVPNPAGTDEALADPFRHRQKDLKP